MRLAKHVRDEGSGRKWAQHTEPWRGAWLSAATAGPQPLEVRWLWSLFKDEETDLEASWCRRPPASWWSQGPAQSSPRALAAQPEEMPAHS